MGGELTKLSETRWRYATARRVYFVRQVRAPDEDREQPGLYRVDGGGGNICVVTADSIEHLAADLRQGQPLAPQPPHTPS
jgi:hypothetical protein